MVEVNDVTHTPTGDSAVKDKRESRPSADFYSPTVSNMTWKDEASILPGGKSQDVSAEIFLFCLERHFNPIIHARSDD